SHVSKQKRLNIAAVSVSIVDNPTKEKAAVMRSPVVRRLYFVSLFIGVSAGGSAATMYTFTTIDVPGAILVTGASGIDDAGQIVGFFNDAKRIHGFLKDGATFTTIDVPGAMFATVASGINDAGQIVGSFSDTASPPTHGFLKDGATLTTIDVPGAT